MLNLEAVTVICYMQLETVHWASDMSCFFVYTIVQKTMRREEGSAFSIKAAGCAKILALSLRNDRLKKINSVELV